MVAHYNALELIGEPLLKGCAFLLAAFGLAEIAYDPSKSSANASNSSAISARSDAWPPAWFEHPDEVPAPHTPAPGVTEM